MSHGPLAIAEAELRQYGCPYCGQHGNDRILEMKGIAYVWRCSNPKCGEDCVALVSICVWLSPIAIGACRPFRTPHPRSGRAHGQLRLFGYGYSVPKAEA
jgi:hypothetical protein